MKSEALYGSGPCCVIYIEEKKVVFKQDLKVVS